MPCYDPRDHENMSREDYYKEFEHNSPLAEHLCSVIKAIGPDVHKVLSDDALLWWAEHQQRDTERG